MGHSAKNYKLSVVGTIPLNLESFLFLPSLPLPSYYCLHLSSIDPFPSRVHSHCVVSYWTHEKLSPCVVSLQLVIANVFLLRHKTGA